MHDYDAEFIWDYEISSHDYIEEDLDYDSLDNENRRDSTDYEQLAYQHYA
mgnify:CR=1